MGNKKGKHKNLVDTIYQELKQKPYVDELFKNLCYKKGECDILYKNKEGNWRYVEVKSNHTYHGWNKAKEQIERFCDFFAEHYTERRCRGVYYSPQEGYKRLK